MTSNRKKLDVLPSHARDLWFFLKTYVFKNDLGRGETRKLGDRAMRRGCECFAEPVENAISEISPPYFREAIDEITLLTSLFEQLSCVV